MIAEGQIHGGALRGLGRALCEELRYDEAGQCITATFMDYAIPTAKDAPPIEIAHFSSPSPLTPLGSKGLGESRSMTVPAVLANAVSDALRPLGIGITELPITRPRLWELQMQRARRRQGCGREARRLREGGAARP
jgi:2-furoyl-CoA dehydrogenase large subunit